MNKSLNVVTCLLLICSAYFVVSKVDEMAGKDDRQVMCQINQHGSTHLMPCRLIASYLAEVTAP